MLNKKLFELAKIYIADEEEPRYVMARENRSWEEALAYIKTKNLRIDSLVMRPKTSQFRFMMMPCKTNQKKTEVFNVNNPPAQFLRAFWEIDMLEIQNALTRYMIQSDLKYQYDNMEEAERVWLTSVILGAQE